MSRHEEESLLSPMDLARAVQRKIIDEELSRMYLEKVKERLRAAGFDGSLLKSHDLLLALDSKGRIMNDATGEPDIIICNFETIWKVSGAA